MRGLNDRPPCSLQRHKPPETPMDVAFLMPEASIMDDRTAPNHTGAGLTMLKVLAAQAGVGVVVAIVFWGLKGRVEAYSALLGSLTCVLPNAFLALRLAVTRDNAGALLRAAWLGELGKLAITVVMFVLIFALLRPLAILPLFAGFIAAQMMIFIGLLIKDGTEDGLQNGG